MTKSETFFTEAEKQQIAATIGEAEKKTSGEIVAMVVTASDTYPEATLLAGLSIGGLSALLITDLFLGNSLGYFLPLMAVGTIGVGRLAKIFPPLLRLFIPATRLETRVAHRALLAFYEKKLHATRDNTGVLFFISLLERKVWILADTGIYQKISQETLMAHVNDIATGIKQGRACNALCREIEAVGVILARHFPIKPDDTNEISNQVLTD
ncbi:MAG: TPM domain-containing protein [Desulfurivibrionaceae bacterium]